MPDPYRMVAVNVTGLITTLLTLSLFLFFYPKKKLNFFLLVLLFSTLPTISIFRSGTYESGDFNIHIYRTMEFFNSLKEGNIMPSWAMNLNATYGYPLFIFNYSLPYYILSFLHLFGISFIVTMKLFLAINFVLSGIFMYFFAKELYKNDFASFASAVFYQFAPYHLIDLHFKVVIGEILFFTLLPLAFLSFKKFYSHKNWGTFFASSLILTMLILTHVGIALFAILLFLAYIFFLFPKNISEKAMVTFPVLFFALLSTLSTWTVPLVLSSYTIIEKITLNTPHFPAISELLYAPWRLGFLFQGPKGEISSLIGYPHVVIILITAFYLSTKQIPKKYFLQMIFWLSSILVLLFLISPYSKTIWESLFFIKLIGSHRLLLLIAFTTSILAGYLVFFVRKKIMYLLIGFAIASTILNWGHRKTIPEITDDTLRKNLWESTVKGEAHFYAGSRWVDPQHPWFEKLPKAPIDVISGEARITQVKRTSTLHSYFVEAATPLLLRENTLFFPGWNATADNKRLAIVPSGRGVITLHTPKGKYHLAVFYTDIPRFKIFKQISLSALMVLLLGTLIFSFKNVLPFRRGR